MTALTLAAITILVVGDSIGERYGIHAEPHPEVELIRAAVGGTTAQQWASTNGTFFANAVAQATGGVDVIVVSLGANDSTIGRGHVFPAQYVAFIARLRGHVGNVPVIAIPFPADWRAGQRHVDLIRAAVRDAPVADYRLVNTSGLTTEADGVHYDAAGSRELGRRIAGMVVGPAPMRGMVVYIR
jgi:lysophospholipase L1-like esterase